MRRGLVALVLLTAALVGATDAGAAELRKVKVGVLKLTSSASVFVGVEKGFFRDAGIEPELVYFQAAQPVAVAIASGDIDVGATGLTAGLFSTTGWG